MRRGMIIVALATIAPLAGAQSWRTLDVSRQLRDSAAMQVHVQYGAGKFGLRPAVGPAMYSMQLRYDPTGAEPIHTYDADSRALRLGMRRGSMHGRSNERNADLRLELTPKAPLNLTIDLGAAAADVDLSGLRIRALNFTSGTSETTVRFDSLNAEHMQTLRLEVGAASLHAIHLANANTDRVNVKAGVGELDLDFGGTWTRDMDVEIEVAVGDATIRLPRDVGVSIEHDKVLASFDKEGLVKRGGMWISDNYDTAKYKLRVRAKTVFGRLSVERR